MTSLTARVLFEFGRFLFLRRDQKLMIANWALFIYFVNLYLQIRWEKYHHEFFPILGQTTGQNLVLQISRICILLLRPP